MAFLQRFSPRSVRIAAASALALSFVGAAFLITSPSFWKTRSVNAESTDQLLAAYASKDTDGDGLPDWQEALYGTDPSKAISNSYGIPDGQAAKEGKLTPNTLSSQLPQDQTITASDLPGTAPAAGSITEQFSHEFLQEYVTASKGQPLTADQQQALVTKLMTELTQKAGQQLDSKYTIVSVHTSTRVGTAEYIGDVEEILKNNEVDVGTGDPLVLMQALLEHDDKDAKQKLLTLAKAYAAIRDDLLSVQTPTNLADEHLELIQSFDSLSKATNIIATYDSDPLGAMGALSIYHPADLAMLDGLTGIAKTILAGGEPASGQPGAYILSAVRLSQKI